MTPTPVNLVLGFVVDLLDIPPSYYEKAADRYQALAEWLRRPDSQVAGFSPRAYLQGSFRYGTVVRPLVESAAYDLDLVCELGLAKGDITQQDVKGLLGSEISAYATAHSFKSPAAAKHRCWRLEYADDVAFHLDILPAIPEDQDTIRRLIERRVSPDFARHAVAITDDRHPSYTEKTTHWPSSNPRGFAKWFEGRLRPYASAKMAQLVERRAYASIDQVPAYEWTTTLQRCIQVLKRHRDVTFIDMPSLKPISMIITTLATLSYQGEPDLYGALSAIVSRMRQAVRPDVPHVPNPLNDAEDFADRWSENRALEANFGRWLKQLEIDLGNLAGEIGDVAATAAFIEKRFRINLTDAMKSRLEEMTSTTPHAPRAAVPTIHIAAAPKPWRCHA